MGIQVKIEFLFEFKTLTTEKKNKYHNKTHTF